MFYRDLECRVRDIEKQVKEIKEQMAQREEITPETIYCKVYSMIKFAKGNNFHVRSINLSENLNRLLYEDAILKSDVVPAQRTWDGMSYIMGIPVKQDRSTMDDISFEVVL